MEYSDSMLQMALEAVFGPGVRSINICLVQDFGCSQKYLIPGDTSSIRKMVELSYNPNSGTSCFVPGRIEDGDTLNDTYKDKY